MLQMCRARPSAASLSGLCSVAMRETLYAEVDLTDAVVNLMKQGHYSGVSVAIFGPTHPAIRNRAITICRTGVTKRHSLGHL